VNPAVRLSLYGAALVVLFVVSYTVAGLVAR
jgi:hypothetical protein